MALTTTCGLNSDDTLAQNLNNNDSLAQNWTGEEKGDLIHTILSILNQLILSQAPVSLPILQGPLGLDPSMATLTGISSPITFFCTASNV